MSKSEEKQENKEPVLSMEDRLKGIAYQFMTLYDRWREDRQIAAAKDAEIAELAKKFAVQVEGLEELGTKMRRDLVQAFKEVLSDTNKKAVEDVKEEARGVVDAVVKNLSVSVSSAQKVLNDSQQVVAEQSNFKMFTIWFTAIVVGLMVGLGVAKWFMPAPVLPLTSNQFIYLEKGRLLGLAWPSMTKKEKDRIARLATEAERKKGSRGSHW